MNIDLGLDQKIDSFKEGTKEAAETAHEKTSEFHENYVSPYVPDCGKYGDAARFAAEMVPGVAEYNAIREGDWQAFAISAGIDVAAIGIGAFTFGTGYAATKGGSVGAKAGLKLATRELAEAGAKKGAKELAEAGAKKGAKEVAEAGVKKGAKELAEAGIDKGAKELAEVGAKKGAKEIIESGTKKGAKELAEAGAEQTLKETTKTGAEKIAKETAEAETKKALKETAEEGAEKAAKEMLETGAEKASTEMVEEGSQKTGKEISENVLKEIERPKNSPIPEKWIERGGKIDIEIIDGEETYTLINSDGIKVPYPDGYPRFPKEVKHPVIDDINIEKFTGDRSQDKKMFMDILESEYGLTEVPEGYVIHHDAQDGVLQLIREDIHKEFTHSGGHSLFKGGQ